MSEPTTPQADEAKPSAASPSVLRRRRKKRKRRTSQYDSAWKAILDGYLQPFLAFYFPDVEQEIDWTQPVVNLDKELERMDPTRKKPLTEAGDAPDDGGDDGGEDGIHAADATEKQPGGLRVDKLFRVTMRSGEDQVLLLHIEIQGDPEKGFEMRMFTYCARLFVSYQVPIISLAVLGDTSDAWRPDHYTWNAAGSKLHWEFPTVKLLDYNSRWDELKISSNVFAMVTMAHLKAKETRSADALAERQSAKRDLVRQLFTRGWSKQEVYDLFCFIDWVMYLPPELNEIVHEDLESLEEAAMPRFMSTFELDAWEDGREEGLEKGQRTILERLLTRRFGKLPRWVLERLQAAGNGELERLSDAVLDAPTLEAVFAS